MPRVLTQLQRLFHMARHLQPSQIVNRVLRLGKNRLISLAPHRYHRHYHRPFDLGVTDKLSGFAATAEILPPAFICDAWLREALARRFSFLNITRELGAASRDFWQAPGASDLWQFNLHYFEYAPYVARRATQLMSDKPDLARLYVEWLTELIADWIAHSKLGDTRWGWHPYVISTRSLNWMAAYAVLRLAPEPIPSGVPDDLWKAVRSSLAAQLHFLSHNLEYDLLGNHLLREAVALVCGSLFFEGPSAVKWRQQGLRVLSRELDQQILADGAHYELSPTYHCLVLQDLLVLAAILGKTEATAGEIALEATISRMLGFARSISHPDGGIALFNDSSLSTALEASQLQDVAVDIFGLTVPMPSSETLVQSSGYWSARHGDDFLIADCGPPADSRCAGHSHCDMLSFELSVQGQRLVVDSGVYEYAPGAMRDYCRSTAAHNTVTVDGREQSEMWHSFRVGRRARVLARSLWETDRQTGLEASIESYDRYFRHSRTIAAMKHTWLIWDQVYSPRGKRAHSFLHLHPEIVVKQTGTNNFVLDFARTQIFLTCLEADTVALAEGWYCPELGLRVNNPIIRLEKALAEQTAAFGYVISGAPDAEIALTRQPTGYQIGIGEHTVNARLMALPH